MLDIVALVTAATAEVIDPYFTLPVAGRAAPLLRERVYTYELYHQLRLLHPSYSPLILSGEPDKIGNPAFTSRRMPDFIFHVPGGHEDNHAVIEVECAPSLPHLEKDLRTFALFAEQRYAHFILLLYGIAEVPWSQLECAAARAPFSLERVTILHHRRSGERAFQVDRLRQS